MNLNPPNLRRLADVVDMLVDAKVGIVQHLEMVPCAPGEPDFFEFAARACNTEAFTRERNFGNTGGASASRDLAMAKAIGEAVERYCGAFFDVEELPLTSASAAPFRCVPPRDFALYSQAQYGEAGFPWVPFEETTPIRWVPAMDPLTGQTWHVPAAMVYVPYIFYEGSGDAPIVQPISTGLACHMSLAEAAVSGLCEVIERDAFTLTWQAGLALPQVRAETLSDANFDLVQRFVRAGNSVTILNATTDLGVPTFLSVLRGDTPARAALVVAGATDPDPERALCKSLDELEHTRRFSQQIKSNLPRLEREPDYGNIIDQVGHLNFWCDHENIGFANFLFASKKRIAFDEIQGIATGDSRRDLAQVAERARSLDHRALLVDLTTPDVASLGFSVVRALIPGLHPLFMGFRIRAAGGRRLWEVPQRLGYPGIARATGDNPYPHAYP